MNHYKVGGCFALFLVLCVSLMAVQGWANTSQALGPFFGPPGPNTLAGRVDVNGNGPDPSDPPAYPASTDGCSSYHLFNPWEQCANTGSFDVRYDQGLKSFQVPGFQPFIVDRFDAQGYPIGGTYEGGSDHGTLVLEQSNPGKGCYDQVRLFGSAGSRPVDVRLSLVEQSGYIGVANIASLGVIEPCNNVNANTQIWLPLGKVIPGPGQAPFNTVIPGGASGVDTCFMIGPPVCGAGQAAVPGLSGWGVGCFILSLLCLSVWTLRRRGMRLSY